MSQKITSFAKVQGRFVKKIIVSHDKDLEIFIVDISLRTSSINLKLQLKEHSQVNVYIYSLNSTTNRVVNVDVNHSSNSISNIFVKCINSKNGVTNININGTAPKSAINIQLNQQIEGILLDSSSTIKVLPSMMVDTNSIKASHAINIGNVNPEQLFYLMSRGISQHDATTILLESMFSQIKKAQTPIYSDIKLKLNRMLGVK